MSNSGNRNSGDRNSGYRNSGDRNSGNRNSGNRNSGNLNSGYRNSGDLNSGNRNSGYRNSGNRNSGYLNSGDCNSGDLNSGNRNSGDRNSGNRNSGNRNSGYLNSDTPRVRIFGVQTELEFGSIEFPNWFYFDILNSENNYEGPCIWIHKDSMTDEEKKNNPGWNTIEGYLKKIDIEKDMKYHRRKAFDKCEDLEDIKKTLEIPHFDYDKFEVISGISKEDFDKKLGKKEYDTINIGGIEYSKEEVEEKLKDLKPIQK